MTFSSFKTVLFSALTSIVILMSAPIAMARDMSDAEIQQLQQTIDNYRQAIINKDFAGVVATMPPKYLDTLAAQVNVTRMVSDQVLAKQLSDMSGNVTMLSLDVDMDNSIHGELNNGMPYVILPTEVIVQARSGKVRLSRQMIALLESGNWYLAEAKELEQLEALDNLYPGFDKITIQEPTIEVIEK